MKITFVAPRFHTNQVFIIEELINRGHQVDFIAQYVGGSEDHTLIKPIVFKNSLIFRLRYYIYQKQNPNQLDPFKFLRVHGAPSFFKYFNYFISHRPDLIIVRDKHLRLSKMTFVICKMLNIPVILYQQIPKNQTLQDLKKHSENKSVINVISTRFLPKTIITPLLGEQSQETIVQSHTYHVPLIMKYNQDVSDRKYFANNRINIISIGKFVPRKRHILLLDAFKELYKQYHLFLTIIGEVTTEIHEQEYNKVKKYILEHGLEESVQVITNIEHQAVQEYFLNHDLFVMPAVSEPLSISPLEAMAARLPVICSDSSGSKEYIADHKSGSIFKSDDLADLKQKIIEIVADREKLMTMGQAGLALVADRYNQSNYYRNISYVISQEFPHLIAKL